MWRHRRPPRRRDVGAHPDRRKPGLQPEHEQEDANAEAAEPAPEPDPDPAGAAHRRQQRNPRQSMSSCVSSGSEPSATSTWRGTMTRARTTSGSASWRCSTGERVILHDERGYGGRSSSGDIWAPETVETIARDVLTTVLLDDDDVDGEHPWEWLAELALAQGEPPGRPRMAGVRIFQPVTRLSDVRVRRLVACAGVPAGGHRRAALEGATGATQLLQWFTARPVRAGSS